MWNGMIGGGSLNHISIYDNLTNKRLAFLENAYNIGYKLHLNKLDEATFTLPADDPKNQYCQPYRYLDIYDRDEFIGLFRILPAVQTRDQSKREIVYTCESVLATLIDDILYGWHEIGNLGVYTTEVISYVLNKQTTPRWQLAQCDFRHQYLYGWENENLLSALFSISKPFVEEYIWDIDTSSTPWLIRLKAPNPDPVALIQYGQNLSGITKTVDPTDLCTRIYPLGYGEGVNQLNISEVNNGQLYIDAPSQSKYGLISRIWVDRRYEDVNSLYSAAQAMLNELSEPYITYTVQCTDLDFAAPINVGDRVRIIDNDEGTDFVAQVVGKSKSDVVGDNANMMITIANKSRNVATTVADLADRQRINEVYAQGAVTVFTKSFADNADARHPAVLNFDLPDNIVHINSIRLNADTDWFRGYSMATGGGGSSVTTTTDGGSADDSTASGGGAISTSDAVVLSASNMISDTDGSGPGYAKHNHAITDGTRLAICANNALEVVGSVIYRASGAHTHEAHSHEIDLPEHQHQFDWEHSHRLSLPDHTHSIEYGIYEGRRASNLRLEVDGVEVGVFEDLRGLNIVPYLRKNDGGNISRSSHTVKLYPIADTNNPEGLSRITADMMIQLFANSRGGGQY